MGGEDRWQGIALAPVNTDREEEQWRSFNNSVNAVSLGFVATAILISMFLVMAIFERFFRPRSSQLPTSAHTTTTTTHLDLQPQITYNDSKLDHHHSHKMRIYAREVSVMMPGEDMPTFIAHPAPAPCLPERIAWPLHQTQTVP
ncbi:hypothetical protein ACFX13_046266 [Malus domestica]|uniref:Uncharacterized protein n=1 Tax=Malus domestica TaxID=3750 RepID=A0A498J2Q5_MALDO|nr:uncharacterized protein LOC103435465 [Malus domestica]XP_050160635.1 uncharacterized protein LOC126634184 [Malus sylvestris]RXH89838.1 hypothetical protein DVH24_032195 [Malus domestica]